MPERAAGRGVYTPLRQTWGPRGRSFDVVYICPPRAKAGLPFLAAGKLSLDDIHMMFVDGRRQKILVEKKQQLAEARIQMLQMVSEPHYGWYRHRCNQVSSLIRGLPCQ
eukprot:2965700-Pyramimonas_sp.AAC.1